MTSQEKGRPLPKFGEWDVNNPASADGFTVIFAKARDEKKAKGSGASSDLPNRVENMSQQDHPDYPRKAYVIIVGQISTFLPKCDL